MAKLEVHHENGTYAVVMTGIQRELLVALISKVGGALLNTEVADACSDIIADAISDFHRPEISGLAADAPWTLAVDLKVLEEEALASGVDETVAAA